MRRWLAVGLLGAAVAALASGCAGASARREGRLVVHGDVRLRRASAERRLLSGAVTLQRGDQLDVRSGTADVALPLGVGLELRGGSRVRFFGGPTLEGGDLLVTTGSAPALVQSSAGTVVVQGASRVRRDLALTVGAYRGTATLGIPGRTLAVPAYRQAAVASEGLLPDRPVPLVLSDADPWDRRFLGRALDLSAQLDAASRGFTALAGRSPGTSGTAAFYRQTLAPLAAEASFTDASLALPATLLRTPRPPGEVLVGAAIALQGRPAPFTARWSQVFAFRDEGATWGLVALDQQADGKGLIDLIDQAINRSPFSSLASGGPVATPVFDTRQVFVAPAPGTSGRGQPRTGNGPAPPPGAPPAPPPRSPQPPPGPVPTPPPSPVSPVVDPVVQLINHLIGGAQSPPR